MKLFIINGENNNEKIEIHINEYAMMEDIKYKLDEILHGNGNFTKYYFKFIHKNIIIYDDNSIQYYKICENDEIWFGKIENYLRKDEVVVYVFHLGRFCGFNYLIVKMSDTILTIKLIIERIQFEIINIWNADGKQMKNDQTVTEIDSNENYNLIIRCDDGEGNEIDNTFVQCCYLHDRSWVDKYLFEDQIRDENKNESTKLILINRLSKIRKIISMIEDDRLNQNLSDLPSSFLNSTHLFCRNMTYIIAYICDDYWRFLKNRYELETVMVFCQYFQFGIRAALWDYSNLRQINKDKTNKSISSILVDAIDYFVKYLIDSTNDWRYWLKLWMKQYLNIFRLNRYLLRSFSEFEVDERTNKFKINEFTINMRKNGKDTEHFITFQPETVIAAKHAISKVHNVDMQHLYCIKPGGDHKPNDEDEFDNEFIIEIMLSMNDSEILRSLGQGVFGKLYLCLDKISNKEFVLKKSIRNDEDICRDINIYSKLKSSKNIMKYCGLFKHKDSICFAMKYMSTGSLRSYLDKGISLSEQETVKISYEILIQINEMHKLGIIHRDIKSDNIVLDEHNNAKLIDFGLSKYTIGLTRKNLSDKLKAYLPGTYYYMAPELIKEEPYSEKIDIWSFGMVMVEMVTSKRPFHRLNYIKTISKIKDCTKHEFKPISPISNELHQFINSCLNANQNERPSAEQLIKSKLFCDYIIYI